MANAVSLAGLLTVLLAGQPLLLTVLVPLALIYRCAADAAAVEVEEAVDAAAAAAPSGKGLI